MIVIEPTLKSQRPPHEPAVMTSQLGVSNAISTPRRFAISVPTSMSKPWYSPSAVSSDWGGYCGSVDILIVPAFRTLSSRPPGIGEAASLGASLGASLAAVSLAAGGSLARARSSCQPPLLVHAPTAIAATASRTSEGGRAAMQLRPCAPP